MRPRTLIALLLLIPLADALLLVFVADFLGWQLTVALVVLTAFLGMLLVRAEGRHTLRRIQKKAAQGQPPTDELLDGALLVAAGAFLLTPGLVTDTVGFLLGFPLTRPPIRVALKKFVIVPYLDRQTDGFATGNVYIGGFPDGEEFDGFGAAAGGRDGGPDDGPGSAGVAGDRFGDADRDEDVVDVDYRVDGDGDDRDTGRDRGIQ